MVRKDVVAARLNRLREYLRTLRAVQEYDLEKFRSDPFIHGTAERYLHLSIECLLDIGNHIISDRGYRKPDTYTEILEILAEEGVVSRELCRKMSGMAAFRNVLVHDYVNLDLEKVYKVIKEQVKNLEEMGRVFSELL
jgi:uncharacterized protein YutE (UPF0331/DUF86 family)